MIVPDKILVVDDDRDIRALLADYLANHGYAVSVASDGPSMRKALKQERIDLIVLDLTLPKEDGLTLCREVRAASATPIIMLTARGEALDRILGLEMGADDYLAKPFEPRELIARIKSVLRRAKALPSNLEAEPVRAFLFAGWKLDVQRHRLEQPDGTIVMLSGAEFRMLKVLIERQGRVLSRDQLMTLAKGRHATSDDRSIDLQISRLRERLDDDAKAPVFIKTVRNSGYVFAVPVQVQGAG
jgi:two-component system, OmpR family, response regulator